MHRTPTCRSLRRRCTAREHPRPCKSNPRDIPLPRSRVLAAARNQWARTGYRSSKPDHPCSPASSSGPRSTFGRPHSAGRQRLCTDSAARTPRSHCEAHSTSRAGRHLSHNRDTGTPRTSARSRNRRPLCSWPRKHRSPRRAAIGHWCTRLGLGSSRRSPNTSGARRKGRPFCLEKGRPRMTARPTADVVYPDLCRRRPTCLHPRPRQHPRRSRGRRRPFGWRRRSPPRTMCVPAHRRPKARRCRPKARTPKLEKTWKKRLSLPMTSPQASSVRRRAARFPKRLANSPGAKKYLSRDALAVALE